MVERRNHEHYQDPTACAALKKVVAGNRFVYICSPYRENPRENVPRARKYCRFAVRKGRIPIAPHIYLPQFISEETEREKAMAINMELLRLCGELWVFGDVISEGMRKEITRAGELGIPARRFRTDCEEA